MLWRTLIKIGPKLKNLEKELRIYPTQKEFVQEYINIALKTSKNREPFTSKICPFKDLENLNNY